MDIAGVTCLRIIIFAFVSSGLYFSIRSLIDTDWAWRVHEFFAELKGIRRDSLYRTDGWEFMNVVGSIIVIVAMIYMLTVAINLKTEEELWHEAAQQAMQQMNEESKYWRTP